ncbi:MAG: NAD(P)/FAD-dependent oxidoreductase, partial [Spirochaetia bacterium]|nr:NAD(P)/FAD-dependent oxidoreductase [Spirochaetia bacterium]
VKPLLEDLGIGKEVTFLPNIVGQNIINTLYPISNLDESMAYLDGLATTFPHQKDELEKVKELMQKSIKDTASLYGSDSPLFARGIDKLIKNIVFITKNLKLLKLLSDSSSPERIPIEEFFSQYISDPHLLYILTKAFFEKSPSYFVLSYHRLFFDYMYPKGGMKTIPLALERVIRKFKGEIYTNTKVERITGSGPFKLILEDKSIIKAKRVVIASDPSQFTDITGIKKGDYVPGESVFSIFVIVDEPVSKVAPHNIGHLFHINDITHTLAESRKASLKEFGNLTNMEISIPAVRDPSLAPKNKTGIIISAPMFATTENYDWLTCSADEYEKMKQEVISGMLHSVSTLIPQLKDKGKISYVSSITPKEYQNKTHNSGGSITGWGYRNEKAPSETSFFNISKSIKTKVDGIYRCGQWTFSPTGAPVSIMTGRLAADALKKSLKEEAKGKKRGKV